MSFTAAPRLAHATDRRTTLSDTTTARSPGEEGDTDPAGACSAQAVQVRWRACGNEAAAVADSAGASSSPPSRAKEGRADWHVFATRGQRGAGRDAAALWAVVSRLPVPRPFRGAVAGPWYRPTTGDWESVLTRLRWDVFPVAWLAFGVAIRNGQGPGGAPSTAWPRYLLLQNNKPTKGVVVVLSNKLGHPY